MNDFSVQPMSLKRPLNVEHEEGGGDNKREKPDDDPAVSNIEQTANGDYQLALPVDKTFFAGLVGILGRTKRYIETKTKTQLFIPQQNGESNDVVITGSNRYQVCAALQEVRNRIATLRRKLRPTHFLAVALNRGEVLERFLELKKKILEAQLPGIDKELFIQEHTIHLTLGIYALVNEEERQRAVQELEVCRSFLAGLKTPFDIKIKGLGITNANPSYTRILFAKIEAPEVQKFADRCLAHFQALGLCAKDNIDMNSIKLHMTVLNNRYRKELMKRCSNNFDASQILKRFGDFDFGSAQCQVVHLCAMQREKDFYKIAGSLQFEDEGSKALEESKAPEESSAA
ncbi:hypothetical protein KR038_009543 [Drosophila bunnanda]|nr:hypothetical protein KR038_009543 [Drosophila bunnanda]